MSAAVFSLSRKLPSDYATLLWDTFFTQRGRGVEMAAHFPWTCTESESIGYGVLRVGDMLVGGATVRCQPASCEPRLASLGLICIAPEFRGRGYSTELLQHMLQWLRGQGMETATLWTAKPAVYAAVGFATCDTGEFGWVVGLTAPHHALPTVLMRRWPDKREQTSKNRGMPPFAYYAQRIEFADESAFAILVFDSTGPSIAEWSGTDTSVADLLATSLPLRWRLNILAGDTLPRTLAGRGAHVNLDHLHLQMSKSFVDTADHSQKTRQLATRVLDRI